MKVPARYLLGVGLALLLAATVYLHGVWVGHFLDLRATSEYCPEKELASDSVGYRWFPPQQTCHFIDGTVRDLVPGYVTPILLFALAVAVVCAVQAVRTSRQVVRDSA